MAIAILFGSIFAVAGTFVLLRKFTGKKSSVSSINING